MKMFALPLAAWWLGVCLGGCHLIFPFDLGAGDGPLPNAETSSSMHDAAFAELGSDWDSSFRESTVPQDPDGGHDGLGKDGKLPVDALFPVDAGLIVPCVTGGQLKMKYASNMVHCSYPGKVLSQCDAVNYCNTGSGWSLCTAAQYQARGGKDQIPPNEAAWIAACVRSGGSPGSPTKIPGICPQCDTTPLSSETIMWTCSSGTTFLPSAYAYVGVHSYGQCLRLGENDSATEANWRARGPMEPLKSALCCK